VPGSAFADSPLASSSSFRCLRRLSSCEIGSDKRNHRVRITSEDAYQVEMEPVAPWLNTLLRRVGRVEAAMIARVDLPIGPSLLCIAEK
jgi:hypothetical protein